MKPPSGAAARQGAPQENQGDGGARKAEAECGQDDAPVEAVREPADRDLEREPTEHGGVFFSMPPDSARLNVRERGAATAQTVPV